MKSFGWALMVATPDVVLDSFGIVVARHANAKEENIVGKLVIQRKLNRLLKQGEGLPHYSVGMVNRLQGCELLLAVQV